jgi:3-carboxy-cis,cis-muconate cycloisomerase
VPDRADPMFSTEEMSTIFSAESHVRAMLAFESALARAEARAGIIPERAAEAIAEKCAVELFDVAALQQDAGMAGTPAAPLVKRLTDLVEEDARGFVHWGATSQDVIDTAMALQARDGLDALARDLMAIGAICAALAERHARTPMAGRTLLQHAVPTSFGLKAAHWLALSTRQLTRVQQRREGLLLQLGGAAGTLAALGDQGIRVAELLAEELELTLPELPWHTDRDYVAELASVLGMTCGAMAKLAQDVALLMQTEVGEVAEGIPEGAGGSSAMPQKRNPVRATWTIASARLAFGVVAVLFSGMVQEHERGVGGWQAEWSALPDLFRFTGSAVRHARKLVETLEVDPERMRANLELGGGQIMAEALMMALAPRLGRNEAFRVATDATRRAATERRDLLEVAAEDHRVGEVLSPDDLRAALDPGSYLGSAEAFVRRAVDRFRAFVESDAPTTWRS